MVLEKQRCNQCEKQCPVDALQCGRGRKYFGLESNEDGREKRVHDMPSGPISQLRQCGHLLHHGSVTGNDLLSSLNAQEQEELERLLGILLADWKARGNTDAQASHRRHHGERK